MVLSIASDLSRTTDGIRQIDVRRDMRAIADLITEAFAGELDAQGQASLRELRSLSRLGPLLYLMVPPNGELGGFMRGFVWEADGEVVGNITIQQADYGGSRWMIANVAVRPEYRQQGIAGALMQAALDRIRELRGEWALLQVDEHNDVALRLYRQLGFQDVVTTTSLRCPTVPDVPDRPLSMNMALTHLYERDWSAMNHLLHRTLPDPARWLNPSRVPNYRRSSDPQFILRWGHLVHLSKRERLGIFSGSDLMGILDLWVRPRREHEIDILLHPHVQDDWTVPLLLHGLRKLRQYPHRPVVATLFDYQTQAIAALHTLGFHTTRTLKTMRKRIPRRGPEPSKDDSKTLEVNHANI